MQVRLDEIKVGDLYRLSSAEDSEVFCVEEKESLRVRLSHNGNNCGWWDYTLLRHRVDHSKT